MAGLTSEQFQVIRQLLDAHPEGQTIPDIVAVLGDKPDARTLRGLLQQLDGVAVRIDTSQHTVRYFALATANANFRSQISDFKSAAGCRRRSRGSGRRPDGHVGEGGDRDDRRYPAGGAIEPAEAAEGGRDRGTRRQHGDRHDRRYHAGATLKSEI